MVKSDLTPRQREAQTVFNKALKRSFWLCFLLFIAATIAISFLWRLLALPTSRLPVGILYVVAAPLWFLAHLRATKAVQRAGLLDESREIVTRTATTFAGEDLWFQYPSTPLGKLALTAGAAIVTALIWWLWRYLADDFFGYAMGALGFALFCCATLLTIATMHQPNASLDERGVFAYRFGFIPTLVRWPEIESAIFTRVSNIHSGADLYLVTLKGADDKTLLVLNPNTFMGSPAGYQQRFIAELKRRLTTATPPQGQENSMAKSTSPRQQAAQKLSWKICNRYTRPILGPMLIAFWLAWFARGTRFDVALWSPLPVAFLVVAAIAIAAGTVVFASKKAMDAVRHAGLLDEGHETIRRTATTFAGEDLAFENPSSRWSQWGFVLGLVGVAALMGWFVLFFATQITERILAALGFSFFFGYALLTVATLNQPAVSLDERGVFSYYRSFWPRLVRWHQIESAHFHRQTNSFGGADICTITLKNAANETLLTLNAATFLDAPPGFEARFVAELRRRLTGEVAT